MSLKRVFILLRGVTFIVSSILFLSACSSNTPEFSMPKKESITTLPKGKAPLLKYLSNTDKKLGNKTALYSLFGPHDAFAAKLFLVDHATTSLDVQYYLYQDDMIGKVFSAHLYMAAERGVHVRILVDDMSTSGKDDKFEKLASHPNIELRLFNPNRLRTSMRNVALLLDVNKLGRRMHNKALIADGAAAIIGGRNIGDVYYAFSKETLFLDYDALLIGSEIPDIYEEFDIYWNSEQSVSSKEILVHNDESSKRLFMEKIQKDLAVFSRTERSKAVSKSDFYKKIANNTLQLTVTDDTDFYYDHPSKISTNEDDDTYHISSQIDEDLKRVDKSIIIISPYFIPSKEMMQRIKSMRARGVKVTIVTNSLSSTDVFAVYSAYKGYIKTLVTIGVDLYEVKSNSYKKYMKRKKVQYVPSIALHTKMMILDDDRLVIGSANMDPRSDKLNTEIMMIVSSKKVVKEASARLDVLLNLRYLYKLSWGLYPEDEDDIMPYHGPVWHTKEKGIDKTYYTPPHTGYFKKIGTDLVSLLPIKGYL